MKSRMSNLRLRWCDHWRTLSRDEKRRFYERSEQMLWAHFADCEWDPSYGEIEDNAMALAYNEAREKAA